MRVLPILRIAINKERTDLILIQPSRTPMCARVSVPVFTLVIREYVDTEFLLLGLRIPFVRCSALHLHGRAVSDILAGLCDLLAVGIVIFPLPRVRRGDREGDG